MFKPLARNGLFLVATLSLSACDDDDDDDGTVFAMEAGAPTGVVQTPEPFGNNPRGPGRNEQDDDSAPDSLPPPVPVEPPSTTTCGDATCRDALVGDIVVSPCCAGGDVGACGLDLSDVDAFMPVTDQCVALDQPGNEDESCPTVYFDDPVAPQELPGCCMPEGLCGVIADLPLLADFGCVDPRELLSTNGGGNDQGGDNEQGGENSDAPDGGGPLENPEEPEPNVSAPQPDASTLDGGPPGASDAGLSPSDAGDASTLRIAFQDVMSLPSCVPAMEEEPEPMPTSDDAGLEPSEADSGAPPVDDTDAGGDESTTAPVVDAAAPADAG